jgi:hypothetical protein
MMKLLLMTAFLVFSSFPLKAQTAWKLMRNSNGIKVYTADVENTKYKSVRVTCTLQGNYDKLIRILTDVEQHSDWVYKTKSSKLLKQNSPTDLLYYSEVSMPWPLDNRDAVVHIVIDKGNLPRFLKIDARSEPNFIAKKEGFIRIPFSHASWHVAMVGANHLNIDYTFQINPGGNVSPWMVNMVADKGPYESFSNLAEMLKR